MSLRDIFNWLFSRGRTMDHQEDAGTGNMDGSSMLDDQTGQASDRGNAPLDFSADQPIATKEEDRFRRWSFAERIAQTLIDRRDPSSIVIGLYGVWGDGKTSTVTLMKRALEDKQGVITVDFNPWHFEHEETLLRGFFDTLAEALGKRLPTRKEEFGKILSQYGSVLSIASASVAGGLVQLSPGSAAAQVGEALSTVTLDELRTRLEAALEQEGKRIVVFIDDIDRLDRQEIQSVFRLVKLSASFNYTSYVLAFDDEMVAAALGERYGGGDTAAGRAFLEKIVQVPLRLPPPDANALRQLTFEGVDEALRVAGIELSEEQVQAYVRHFVDGLEPQLSTPRQGRRYGNALLFSLPLLKGEVHPVDHMLIEGIRVFYPTLYRNIRDNPDYFLAGDPDVGRNDDFRNRLRELAEEGFQGTGVDPERVGRRLINVLFPRTGPAYGGANYGHDWDERWEREQRISSKRYFSRYFSYAIPPGDVSDLELNTFIASVATADDAELDAALLAFASKNAIPHVIDKLRKSEITIPEPEKLARAVARNGALMPKEEHVLSFGGTLEQAAILVRHLTQRVLDAEARAALARDVITMGEPLAFAARCFWWMRKGDDEAEEERTVPEAVENELGEILAERIEARAADVVLYREYGNDAPALFYYWEKHGEDGAVSNYLRSKIDPDNREVIALLDSYVGKSWGLETGLSRKSDFSRDQYNRVIEVLDADYIVEKLRELFGAELDNPEYHHADDAPFDRRVSHQFAVVHQGVQQEQGAAGANDGENADEG